MKSPAFSSFRSLLDLWDEAVAREDLERQIRSLVEGPSFILFFTKRGDIYGAPEESRVVFARLRNGEKDDEYYDEEANFLATNLSGVIRGDGSQCVFGKDDVRKLKIIDRDEAIDRLLVQAKKDPEPGKTASVIRIVAKETRGA